MALIAAVALLATSLVSIEALVPVQDHSTVAGQQVKLHKIVALQQTGGAITKGRQPKDEGHKFLNKEELKPITSIHCLQEKQRHPNVHCVDKEVTFEGAIDMGNFPNWQQPVCHANGEFMCDPANLLKPKEQTATQVRLQGFKERNMINCGEFSAKQDSHSADWFQKDMPHHGGRLGLEDHRPFNLAVVVADQWPSNEMDPKSIEYFGNVIMSQWGLMPIYNGVDTGNRVNQVYSDTIAKDNCPNTAVLFILPKYHEAFISSPSCEFLCASKGGPEVIAATLAGLDRGGLQEAVLSGIDQIEKVLEVTKPLSMEKPWARQAVGSQTKELMKADATWVWIIRLGYIFTIGFAVMCIVAFVYFVLLPQGPQNFRSVSSMSGVNARKAIQGHMAQGQ